jgi:hypothetical protein
MLGEETALIISAVGVLIALAALIRACMEYVQQGRQRRAQLFFDLRHRLKEPELARVAELIDLVDLAEGQQKAHHEQELRNVDLRIKRDYIGLFEEVAVMMEWKLVSPSLANYMFGYYARLCERSTAFWDGPIAKDNPYWGKFHRFCRQMDVEDVLVREEHERLP